MTLLFKNKSNNYNNIIINQTNNYFYILCNDFKINNFLCFIESKENFFKNGPVSIIKDEEDIKISMIKCYKSNKIDNKLYWIYSSENFIYINYIEIKENISKKNYDSKNFFFEHKFSFCNIEIDNENQLLIADEDTDKILLYNFEFEYLREIGC